MKIRSISALLVFLIVLTLPLLVSAANGDLMKGAPKPEIERADAEACVEDVAYMRANHMNVLKEAREQAVRFGVRTEEHSLKNCFTCHKDKSKFCDACHQYAGVQPGCFGEEGGCHFAPTTKK